MDDEPDRLSNRLLEYDPNANKWRELAPMKYSKYRCCAVVLNNEIYVMGKICCSANSVSKLSILIQINFVNEMKLEDMMLQLELYCTDICNKLSKRCYFAGGIGCEGGDRGQSRHCLTLVEIYNPDGDFWREGPSLPCAQLSLRTNASNAGVVGGKIYVCGYYKGAGNNIQNP